MNGKGPPNKATGEYEMDELKLAALMCSKVCHDLISPVGALANGIEVLQEDDDPEMREHAMTLLDASATQASAKLKFARLAYGSAGSMGREIDLAQAEVAIKDLHGGGKVAINWMAPSVGVDKDVVKVLVNVAHIAFDCIPRGGDLIVKVREEGGHGSADVLAKGTKAKLSDDVVAGFNARISIDDLDARTIIPHVCGLLARGFGDGVMTHAEEDVVKFSFTF